jgi:hypothetical protein
MRWNIIVECVGEDGQRSTITLGAIERLAASTTAENLGVNLRESKQVHGSKNAEGTRRGASRTGKDDSSLTEPP